jgi:hypothetical protein
MRSSILDRFARKYLILVPIGLYLVLSSLYALAIPIGESPDEPSHLQCIEQVSNFSRLPEIATSPPAGTIWWARAAIISDLQCYHMPLYYLISGYLQRLVGLLSGSSLHFEFPPNNPDWGNTPNMFVHPERSFAWILNEPVTVVAVRVESMLLGLITLWASYKTARVIFAASSVTGIAAATLVAGWPQYLFMSRAINNDALAIALSVIVLISLISTNQPRRFMWASLFSSLAILAKVTAAFTVGVVVATFLFDLLNARGRRVDYLLPGFISSSIFLGLAVLIRFQPTLYDHFTRSITAFGGVSSSATNISYWSDVLLTSLSSGWARLGWMNIPTPDWQAYGWWMFIAITSIGGIRAAHLTSPDRTVSKQILFILGLWVMGVLASYMRINANRFQPQFRFAFPLLPVITAFAAGGYVSFLGYSSRRRVFGLLLLIIVLMLANFWIVFNLLVPTYSR